MEGTNPNRQAQSSLEAPPQRELPLKIVLKKRLEREGRWHGEAELVRDELMREARDERGMSKEDAQTWVYEQLQERFPPPPPPPEPISKQDDGQDRDEGNAAQRVDDGELTTEDTPARPRDDAVVGLNAIPESWLPLPANASLAAEIQWVQANRLLVVKETASQTVVDLSKSLAPAPSYASLGWLETAIRAFSKFCDIAAKATSQLEDDREHVRREKLAIDEMRIMLEEMLPGPPCPTCGQSTPPNAR